MAPRPPQASTRTILGDRGPSTVSNSAVFSGTLVGVGDWKWSSCSTRGSWCCRQPQTPFLHPPAPIMSILPRVGPILKGKMDSCWPGPGRLHPHHAGHQMTSLTLGNEAEKQDEGLLHSNGGSRSNSCCLAMVPWYVLGFTWCPKSWVLVGTKSQMLNF